VASIHVFGVRGRSFASWLIETWKKDAEVRYRKAVNVYNAGSRTYWDTRQHHCNFHHRARNNWQRSETTNNRGYRCEDRVPLKYRLIVTLKATHNCNLARTIVKSLTDEELKNHPSINTSKRHEKGKLYILS